MIIRRESCTAGYLIRSYASRLGKLIENKEILWLIKSYCPPPPPPDGTPKHEDKDPPGDTAGGAGVGVATGPLYVENNPGAKASVTSIPDGSGVFEQTMDGYLNGDEEPDAVLKSLAGNKEVVTELSEEEIAKANGGKPEVEKEGTVTKRELEQSRGVFYEDRIPVFNESELLKNLQSDGKGGFKPKIVRNLEFTVSVDARGTPSYTIRDAEGKKATIDDFLSVYASPSGDKNYKKYSDAQQELIRQHFIQEATTTTGGYAALTQQIFDGDLEIPKEYMSSEEYVKHIGDEASTDVRDAFLVALEKTYPGRANEEAKWNFLTSPVSFEEKKRLLELGESKTNSEKIHDLGERLSGVPAADMDEAVKVYGEAVAARQEEYLSDENEDVRELEVNEEVQDWATKKEAELKKEAEGTDAMLDWLKNQDNAKDIQIVSAAASAKAGQSGEVVAVSDKTTKAVEAFMSSVTLAEPKKAALKTKLDKDIEAARRAGTTDEAKAKIEELRTEWQKGGISADKKANIDTICIALQEEVNKKFAAIQGAPAETDVEAARKRLESSLPQTSLTGELAPDMTKVLDPNYRTALEQRDKELNDHDGNNGEISRAHQLAAEAKDNLDTAEMKAARTKRDKMTKGWGEKDKAFSDLAAASNDYNLPAVTRNLEKILGRNVDPIRRGDLDEKGRAAFDKAQDERQKAGLKPLKDAKEGIEDVAGVLKAPVELVNGVAQSASGIATAWKTIFPDGPGKTSVTTMMANSAKALGEILTEAVKGRIQEMSQWFDKMLEAAKERMTAELKGAAKALSEMASYEKRQAFRKAKDESAKSKADTIGQLADAEAKLADADDKKEGKKKKDYGQVSDFLPPSSRIV